MTVCQNQTRAKCRAKSWVGTKTLHGLVRQSSLPTPLRSCMLKRKGRNKFQAARGWENSCIKAMNHGIAWTLQRTETPASVSTLGILTWDRCAHQRSADTNLLVQLIFEPLLPAVSTLLYISMHRRTISYSAFWKMKNNIGELNIATSTALEVLFGVTTRINDLVGMCCRYQETWSTAGRALRTQC